MRVIQTVAFCFAAGTANLLAQNSAGAQRGHVIDITTRERWMNARQQPQFTPFVFRWNQIIVDGNAIRAAFTYNECASPDTINGEGLSLGWGDIHLDPSASATQWVAPPFRPVRTTRGARWRDTVKWTRADDGLNQTLDGIRVSTLERDTLIDGQRFWVVRDSTPVRYTDRCAIDEYGFGHSAYIERRMEGTIIGRYLFAPSDSAIRSRTDTSDLRGQSTLVYPDGRRFTTRASFTQSRTWKAYNQRDFALEKSALDSAERSIRNAYGSFSSASDADARDQVRRRIFGNAERRYTVEDVQFLLPFMEAPGLAFDYDIPRTIYGSIAYSLMSRPPALTHDSAASGCTPDACALLAEQRTASREPRLQSLGLIALTMSDPKKWDAALRQRASLPSDLARAALDLIDGIGSRRPYALKLPIPDSGVTWRAWQAWLGEYGPVRPSGPNGVANQLPPWRFPIVNRRGVRYREFLTGRNISTELEALLTKEKSDTARFVLISILEELEAPRSLDSIAAYFTGDSPLMRTLGLRIVERRLYDSGDSTESPLQDELHAQMFDSLLARRAPWKVLEGYTQIATTANRPIRPDSSPGTTRRVYLDSTTVSTTFRDAWRTRVSLVNPIDANEDSVPVNAEVWRLRSVRRLGQFARVRAQITLARRDPTQRSGMSTAERTYTLMSRNGEWIIIDVRRGYSGQ